MLWCLHPQISKTSITRVKDNKRLCICNYCNKKLYRYENRYEKNK